MIVKIKVGFVSVSPMCLGTEGADSHILQQAIIPGGLWEDLQTSIGQIPYYRPNILRGKKACCFSVLYIIVKHQNNVQRTFN